MLRDVTATRYVTPLREGGSLPAIVEADDLGMYVVKFRGAGQGRKALVAEVVAGELGRLLGLPVPELVTVQLDESLAKGEPDQEIQALLLASLGRNLGVDYLPGSIGYDPLAFAVDPELAGRVLWFDALVGNVDRSWRNPNLLRWHGRLYLIDHGASLIFQHNWPGAAGSARRPPKLDDHVLLPFAPDVAGADAGLAPLVTAEAVDAALALVPDEWLAEEPGFETPDGVRAAFRDWFAARLGARDGWLPDLAASAVGRGAAGQSAAGRGVA
ncbi:MAG TPA: HipA family kinase [Actinocrinis sp.]|nr:HipA family kinase [Actinocrinis sp.]